MKDSHKQKGLRKKLVLELFKKGIRDEKVLNAINLIPRHLFLHKDFENFAYIDKPFQIGEDQTISQPYTVAFQTEKLEIKPGDKILEIGGGSGYQTSILVSLNADVYTIERIYNLFKSSKKILSSINLMPKKTIWGDGYLGLVEEAPFDKILIAAACNEIPKKLLRQLKIGGKMILPIGNQKNKL